MNKKIIDKMSFFLKGLESRLTENKEFFREITIDWKSGTKIFTEKITVIDDMLTDSFSGRQDYFSINKLADVISEHAGMFESCVIRYIERGRKIVIEADERNVKMKTEEMSEQVETIKNHAANSQISHREYLIKVGQADDLLMAIGILGQNGKIRNDMIRKYNQIDHFVELINPILLELCEKEKEITVLDCACGKSYLSFVLNYYIKEVLKKPCYFIGVDYSDTVIKASRKIADSLCYKNMNFIREDLNVFSADRRIDLCISLHACDTATDAAIALGIRNNSRAIVAVPCCHKELLHQLDMPDFRGILKNGILKARIADILTDGLRAMYLEGLGYEVSVVEYISPLETPKNILIKAIKREGYNKSKMEEYNKLCALVGVSPSLKRLT